MPKLNLDYYKEDINYNSTISETEEIDIIKYINEYNREDYNKIFEKDTRLNIFLALSNIRENIINWYDFNKDADILEIGAEFGAITGFLCENANSVTSFVTNKKRADSILKRYNDKDNLEIVVGSFKNINFTKKFDYITLIGIMEYTDFFINNENSFQDFLEDIKKLLKNNGKILIAIDNKFGVKSFAEVNIHKIKNNSILQKNYTDNFNKLFSRNALENLLKSINLNSNFYYPLPDYKLPEVIFSDRYLPEYNSTKINFISYHYNNSLILFDEINAYKEIISENKFSFFTNSFFIECSANNNFNDTKFVSFNNTRKEEYKLITKINSKEVIKKSINNKSENHIENISNNISRLNELGFNIIDKKQDNAIISKFIEFESMDKYLIKNESKLIDNISVWYEYINNKLIKTNNIKNNIFILFNIDVEENILNKLNFIEDGLIDLVFENIFINNDEYLIFDQEWYFKNVPIEFILYRAIKNLYTYNPELEKKHKINDIYIKFEIDKYIEVFNKLEISIQDMIKDKCNTLFYNSSKNSNTNLSQIVKDMNTYKDECIRVNKLIDDFSASSNKKISILQTELDNIHNSKLWKNMKILKNITNKFIGKG